MGTLEELTEEFAQYLLAWGYSRDNSSSRVRYDVVYCQGCGVYEVNGKFLHEDDCIVDKAEKYLRG